MCILYVIHEEERKKVNELQQEEETKRMKWFQVSYMMEMSGDC